MSLETKIEELTGTVAALTTIIQQQLAVQERLLAGQAKAIETVAAGNPAAPAKRGRKAKDDAVDSTDTQNTSAEPADTASGADDASSAAEGNSAGADTTTDTTHADTGETTTGGTTTSTASAAADAKSKLTFAVAAKTWLDQKEQGSAEYKVRGKTIMGILGNFGAAKMSEFPAENEDKAMFYLKRAVSGLTINFDAEYDFEGDPKQDEPVAAEVATADEDEDIFA